MPTFKERRLQEGRRSDNIVDLREKTQEEREAMYSRLLAQGGDAFENQLRGEREQKFYTEQEQKRNIEELKERMREAGMDANGYRQQVQALDMNSERGQNAYQDLQSRRKVAIRLGV